MDFVLNALCHHFYRILFFLVCVGNFPLTLSSEESSTNSDHLQTQLEKTVIEDDFESWQAKWNYSFDDEGIG